VRSTPKSWPITSIRVCGNRARSAAAREYRPRPAYFGGRSDGFAPRRDAIDISRCLQIRAYRERNLCCDPCLPSQMCVAHVRGFASYRRDWRSRRRAPEGPESVRRGFSPLQGNAQPRGAPSSVAKASSPTTTRPLRARRGRRSASARRSGSGSQR
jgi:hypothetical protein